MSAFGQKRTLMRFAISALSLVGRESPFARSSDHENIAGKIEPPGEKLRNVMAASKRSTSIVRPTANAVNQSRLGNASFFPSVALRSHRYCQLALRTSVSSTSVTVITPGAGCSITSTATASTTGATGCFTFRAAFFTGVRLGLALATVLACAVLRALPRFAEFLFRSLARLCTFVPFLRLAMIAPFGAAERYNCPSRSELSNISYQQIAVLSARGQALCFLGRTEAAIDG
jgi:hypothetical protein